MSDDTLSGFVRVIAKGPFEGWIGVVYWDYRDGWYEVRFQNEHETIMFELFEIEALDTQQATALLQETHGKA